MSCSSLLSTATNTNCNRLYISYIDNSTLGLVIFRPHHHTTHVDAAYFYRLNSVVCQSVTVISPAKTAEPIEMPFGMLSRVDQRNHNGVQMAQWVWALLAECLALDFGGNG